MSRGIDPDIHAIFPLPCWKQCDAVHERVRLNRGSHNLCSPATGFEYHYSQCYTCVWGQDRQYCNVCENCGCWTGKAFEFDPGNPDPALNAIFGESLQYCSLSQPTLISPPFKFVSWTGAGKPTAIDTATPSATSDVTTTSHHNDETAVNDQTSANRPGNNQISNDGASSDQSSGTSDHLSSSQLIGIIFGALTALVVLLTALAYWKYLRIRQRALQLSKKGSASGLLESQGTQEIDGRSINELDDPPAPRIEMDVEPGANEMDVGFTPTEMSESTGYRELAATCEQNRREDNARTAGEMRQAFEIRPEQRCVELSVDSGYREVEVRWG